LESETPILVNTVDDRNKDDVKRYGNPYDNTIDWHQPVELKGIENLESLNDIEVIVQYNNAPVPLKSEPGKVPHKICVPIKTKWPYERIVINQAYDFNDYVKNGSSVKYVGENADTIFNSKREVIGFYLDERGRKEAEEDDLTIWEKSPSESQVDSRYHGLETDDSDITGIPYKDSARVIGSVTETTDLEDEEETITIDNNGYQTGYPVLIRARH
jgi:hypothetical protein